MGIHDRDYYRNDGGSWFNSLTRHGQVCTWLIVLNVIMFVAQIAGHSRPETDRPGRRHNAPDAIIAGPITQNLDLNARDVLHGQVWRLVTHAFLHADFWHILFNMLLLYWFGRDIEGIYGSKEFLAFYLTSAVLAGLAFVACSAAGMGSGMESRALGASGAVMAVIVLFACHFPFHRIWVFFLLPLPIWVLVVIYVGFDAYQLLVQDALGINGGVAFAAHLGGAAFGALYYVRSWRVLNWIPNWPSRMSVRKRPKLRVYREESPSRRAEASKAPREEQPAEVAANPMDEHLEAQVDAVLAKVARQGQDSLTDDERKVLQRASELYRQRRK
ncbi:MAG TPA: rhomboid family intramembrane serine protease [Gemmataceae bacterium]|jgi:membrane associated rhomboid family serine protease|nr:rhomboid family intramembrane serine protease [Gemmataceae bacterium]